MMFKKARVRCKTNLPGEKFLSPAQGGLYIVPRKKFKGEIFRDLFGLFQKATKYKRIVIKEEVAIENSSRGTSSVESLHI